MTLRLMVALALASTASPALADNILLTNDDGLTSNVKALYAALKADGHDVIVVVPCQGQSGMGAAAKFLRPLGPLASDCLNGAARKGDPGTGPLTRDGFAADWFYVDGTPVMATLYGLDVAAEARWGRAPDLILSGPNEGQNVGAMIISSGTVSNVQYGTMRGVPSIALSAGSGTADNAGLANPHSPVVAALTVELVRALKARSNGKPLLPAGIALNVNFPDKLEGARWRQSRIGSYQQYLIEFVPDIGQSPAGKAFGIRAPLPGVALDFNTAPPAPAQMEDESIVFRSDIAISPMQVGYEPAKPGSASMHRWLRRHLKGFLAR
jgi:5'-nucleotidase